MRIQSVLSSVTTLCLFSVLAHAGPLTVVNPSFETVPVGGFNHPNPDGPFNVGSVPGWTLSGPGPSGEYQPVLNGNTFNNLDDGPTVAYSNSGTISQDIGTVDPGMIYTMTVDIGNRIDTGNFASADLLINGVTYAALGTTGPKGTWTTFTATYQSLAADVGDTITIELRSTGGQADFDNVTASSSPVPTPEPGLTGILGMALAGLGIYGRRKKRQ